MSSLLRSALRIAERSVAPKDRQVRAFSRQRPAPSSQNIKPPNKEEYKQLILERARLRREFLKQQVSVLSLLSEIQESFCRFQELESVTAAEEVEEDAVPEEETEEAEEESESEMSEMTESEEEEEEPLTETELFSELMGYEEPMMEPRARSYVPFVTSKDDDEYS